MRDAGQAVDRQRPGHHAQQVQALAGQRHLAHKGQQQPAASHPGRDPDRHLQRELPGHGRGHVKGGPAGPEHRDQQRDADRVVGP